MSLNTLFAYIDPGSGALLLQMCVAAVVGALVYVKKTRDFIWQKLSRLLGFAVKPEPAKTEAQPAAGATSQDAPKQF
jgi:hypothetical protein